MCFCFGCSQTITLSPSTNDYFRLSQSEKEELIHQSSNGNAIACLRIANYYKFVEKNKDQWLIWLKKAADLGNTIAQDNLANYLMASKDREVQKQAIFWYKKTAESGDVDSYLRLAEIFENGNIIKKDLNLAKDWYEKASFMGNTIAIEKLSDFYLEGNGCDRNKIKAYALLSFAELFIETRSVRYKEIEVKKQSIKITEAEQKQAEIELNSLKEKYKEKQEATLLNSNRQSP